MGKLHGRCNFSISQKHNFQTSFQGCEIKGTKTIFFYWYIKIYCHYWNYYLKLNMGYILKNLSSDEIVIKEFKLSKMVIVEIVFKWFEYYYNLNA